MASDISGRRINWGDRLTRNIIFGFFSAVYGLQFIAPHFGFVPEKEIDPTLMKGLDTLMAMIIGYLIGKDRMQAKEGD